MEKQRIKSKRISGRRLLIVLLLLNAFPSFSQSLTNAMLREIRILPSENQELWVNKDIKFEAVIPYTLPSQIDLSMPQEDEEIIFKTLRKVESGGGTKIEIWYQFTKTGTYKPKALTVKIKNSRRQLEFGTVTIGINPGEQLPLCVIKTPQGNNKNLTVRAGEKLEFSLCLQYALQLTQFTWELPKDSLFVQTKTYEFTQIKQREKLVSNELIPVSDFEWTPLLPGEINFPAFTIQAIAYNGDKVYVRMPDIRVKVLEAKERADTEGTSYFEKAFTTDEILDEGNNFAQVSVEDAKLIAQLRSKERHSVLPKARKLRIVLEREYNLPYSQKEFKLIWLYLSLGLLLLITILLIICIHKKRHGLNLLCGVALVLVLVAAIYCGVCSGKKYGISIGCKLYSIPEAKASITSELPAGNRVQIISQTENWYQLRFGQSEGWCQKDEIIILK